MKKFSDMVKRPKGWGEGRAKPALKQSFPHWSYTGPIKIYFGKKIKFVDERTGKVFASHHNDAKVITNEVIRVCGMWGPDASVFRSGGGLQPYCELPTTSS